MRTLGLSLAAGAALGGLVCVLFYRMVPFILGRHDLKYHSRKKGLDPRQNHKAAHNQRGKTRHQPRLYEFVKTFPVFSKGFEIETEMTIHAVNYNMQALVHHLPGAVQRICVITVNHQIALGVHLPEHSPDHIPLAFLPGQCDIITIFIVRYTPEQISGML